MTGPTRQLFEVNIEVDAAGHAPPFYSQATVTCALWAADAHEAGRRAAADLTQAGYRVIAGLERLSRLDPTAWDHYLQSTWPAQVGRVPGQAELLSLAGDEGSSPIQLAFYPHE